MWIVRVKDRGRDLVYHRVEREEEAVELATVYRALGYAEDRVLAERIEDQQAQAA